MGNKDRVPLKIASGRKLTLPKSVCKELGLEEGDHIMLEIKSEKAVMIPLNRYEVKE